MLEKKISNLSTTLIVNSYECFPIQTNSNKVISYNLIKEKYDATGLISISRAISALIGTDIIGESKFTFETFGDSGAFLVKAKDCLGNSGVTHLKESHISFHTYVEDINNEFLIIRLEYHICSCSDYNVYDSIKAILPHSLDSDAVPTPDLITLDYLRRGAKFSDSSNELHFDYHDINGIFEKTSYQLFKDIDSTRTNGTRQLFCSLDNTNILTKLKNFDYEISHSDVNKFMRFLQRSYCTFNED